MREQNLCMDHIRSFSDFSKFLERAELTLSLWQGRRVVFKGCSGSTTVGQIIHTLYALVEKDPDFSEEERVIGKCIAARIDRLYMESQTIFEKAVVDHESGYLCYFLTLLTDTSKEDSAHEYHWNLVGRELFDYYTETQYQSAFQKELPRYHWRIVHLGKTRYHKTNTYHGALSSSKL